MKSSNKLPPGLFARATCDGKVLFIVIVLVLVVGLAGAGFLYLASMGAAVPAAKSQEKSATDNLESLRSLPYVAWTDEDADTEKSGVEYHDTDRAWTGYNLYTNDVDEVYLMDMYGEIVHQWSLPGKHHCELAEWLGDGDLLVVCQGQSVVKINWAGEIQWEAKGAVNHDVAILPNGAFLVSVSEMPREYHTGAIVIFDSAEFYSPDGKLQNIWSTFNQLELLQEYHPLLALDDAEVFASKSDKNKTRRYEYYHLNSIEMLPDTPLGRKDSRFKAGNVMFSLRNANVVVIIDSATGKPVWGWGPGELDYQHMPTMLENGNILIYDNGTHRGYTRIIEIEPVNGEIVWSFTADPPESFFSKWRGSNQRLPNGNTLICDSESGRVFEVTHEGEVVWDFWNPEIKEDKRKRIYRFMRISPESVDELLNQTQL